MVLKKYHDDKSLTTRTTLIYNTYIITIGISICFDSAWAEKEIDYMPVTSVATFSCESHRKCRVLECVRARVRSHTCVRKSRCERGAKPLGIVRAKCVRVGVFMECDHRCDHTWNFINNMVEKKLLNNFLALLLIFFSIILKNYCAPYKKPTKNWRSIDFWEYQIKKGSSYWDE